MLSRLTLTAALLAALLSPGVGAETLRYSGSLMDAGAPANGTYAFRVALYDAPNGGRRIGKEITMTDVVISGGSFTTQFDFGMPQALLDRLWMQVEVAGPEGVFEPLGERDSMDAKALASAACWSTAGNAGTSPSTDFVGTLDMLPLIFKVGGKRALRLSPTAGPPNVIGGQDSNFAQGAVQGATIAGGGETGFPNVIEDHLGTIGGGSTNFVADGAAAVGDSYGTIGGGQGNSVLATHGTIGGGSNNTTLGRNAVVPGGAENLAGGLYSFAAGQYARVRAPIARGATPPSSDTTSGDVSTFVWNGGAFGAAFVSTGPNQFLVRSPGGAGINTNNPDAALHVRHTDALPLSVSPDPGSVIVAEKSAGNSFISIIGAVGAQRGILFGEPNSSADGGITYDNTGSNAMEFRTAGNVTRMTLAANGNLILNHNLAVLGDATKPGGGSWGVLSDARLKRRIEPLSGALDRLLTLRGVRFEYASTDALRPAGMHDGFIAQEVQKTFPDWVNRGADGYLTVAPRGFESLTVEALRELAEENALLREELEELKALVVGRDARSNPKGR